jgi:integrase
MREKPWFRKQTKHWYIEIAGKQHKLCPGESRDDRDSERLAHAEWHALAARLAEQPSQAPAEPKPRAAGAVTTAWLANRFLGHTQRHCEAETYRTRRSLLKRFVAASVEGPDSRRAKVGEVPAVQLKKWHLQGWLDAHTKWSGPTRRMAINVVLTMMNWGVSQEYIPRNPLKGFKKPPEGVRDRTLTPEQIELVLAAVKDTDRFKDYLVALKLTGARPSEVRRVTAADFREPGIWVLDRHKNSKKAKGPRVIYLCPTMVEMTRRLSQAHPEGPLFLNNRTGAPWTSVAVEQRFRKLSRRLKFPVTSYLFRSAFCTAGLKRGVDVAHMATLLGHKDTSMVMRHYAKISGEIDHMIGQASKAVGG